MEVCVRHLCSNLLYLEFEEIDSSVPFHLEKVIVCCSLLSDGIIGPFLFKSEYGVDVTVHVERYMQMIRKFLTPHVNSNRLRAR